MRLNVFWRLAAEALSAGEAVFCSMVVGKRKGSPGTIAARLLLTQSGRQYGTIGGGIMEKREIDAGTEWLRTGELASPQLCHLAHRATELDRASGLVCGGDQTNLRFLLRPETDASLVAEIAAAAADEADAVVRIDPRGLWLEEVVGKWTGNPVWLQVAERSEGGDWTASFHLRNPRRIAIFGGGHCGAALAGLMHGLGYAVSVVEPRTAVIEAAGLPEDVVHVGSAFESGAAAVRFAEMTHAVVMTYSMLTDVDALEGCLKRGFRSIGVMGSRPKIAKIRSLLGEKGFSGLHVDAIRAPIGLVFDSDTPEEIAVSVAAQLLMERGENNYG